MDSDYKDIIQVVGETKKIKIHDEIYLVSASPICDLPILKEKLTELGDNDLSDIDVSLNKETIDKMCSIMMLGLRTHNQGITIEKIKSFPLSAFPVILKIMLDLNDFLSQMGEVQKPMQTIHGLVGNTQAGKGTTDISPKLKKKVL
jgi:hypothetical protein